MKVELLPRAYYTEPKSEVEKTMAPHSGTLAWKIPWTEESGRLPDFYSFYSWLYLIPEKNKFQPQRLWNRIFCDFLNNSIC